MQSNLDVLIKGIKVSSENNNDIKEMKINLQFKSKFFMDNCRMLKNASSLIL